MVIVLGVLAGLILLFFALIGAPYLFRSTPVERVVDIDGSPSGLTFESAGFQAGVELTLKAPIEPGTSARILNNGNTVFPALWEDLRSAQRSITIVCYFAQPGDVADTLARILIERARNGVAVYWVRDAVGSGKLTDAYFGRLREAGVHIATFRRVRWYTLDRANNRSHVRSVVIDGRIGYTGGFGFDDNWLGDGRSAGQWRDTNVRLTGRCVSRLQASFVGHWAESAAELILSESLITGREDSDEKNDGLPLTLAGLVISLGTMGSSPAERLLAMTITLARRSLLITNAYFVPDDDFIALLLDARRRGVDVQVLTNGPRIDVKLARRAGRHRYTVLLEAGVRIFEYLPTVLHAKTLVADGKWGVIGTINFDNRSLAFNDEVGLVALDPAFGARLEDEFRSDLGSAREITLERFERRGWLERTIERAADLMWRWV